uniref:uncharacterized protein LOC141614087 n=1 Tax=Silene latifolia TaxID=37657 RepID=UPI003D76D68B
MVFVPFTGVDNHKGCITFAAGLIRNENAESFSWLFQNFVTAMGDRYPITIITDQCRGIKKAVKGVFGDKTRHRLCMWHIMKKLPDKVGPSISQDTTFLKEINSVVWDVEITPEDFESKWNSIISSYELCDNKWLKKMFKHRALWIHAYIRDTYLGGILRTTSRSVSKIASLETSPTHMSHLSSFGCVSKQQWMLRDGNILRHILWLLKDRGFDHIPKEYLALRWSKSATSHPLSTVVGKTVLADCVSIENRQNNISELWSEVFSAVSLVEDSEEHSDALFQLLRSFNEKLIISIKSGKSKDKKAEIEMLLGSKIPTEVTVLPPEKCKNKGSGKRITSNKEKAVLENAKPLRKCRACVQAIHPAISSNGSFKGHAMIEFGAGDERECFRQARKLERAFTNNEASRWWFENVKPPSGPYLWVANRDDLGLMAYLYAQGPSFEFGTVPLAWENDPVDWVEGDNDVLSDIRFEIRNYFPDY